MAQPIKIAIGILIFLVGVAVYFRLRIWLENLTVTSWFRSPSHNKRVGGVSNSLHLLGWAFDVVPVNPATVAKLRAMGFRKVIAESDHVHAQIA